MNEREKMLIKAAMSVFMRYGIKKTTMNDIASEAGVARQTLYNVYPSKEAVMRAAVRYSGAVNLAEVKAVWATQTDFADMIETFQTLVALKWYDVLQSFPDAADLVDGLHTTTKDEMDLVAQDWCDAFEAIIITHAEPESTARDAPKETADFIYSACLNAKYSAANRDVLIARLRLLKLSVVALSRAPAAQTADAPG